MHGIHGAFLIGIRGKPVTMLKCLCWTGNECMKPLSGHNLTLIIDHQLQDLAK